MAADVSPVETPSDPALVQQLIARLPDVAVLTFDRGLRFTAAGGPGLAGQGWDPAELLGRRLDDVLDAPRAAALGRYYRPALAGETRSFRYRGIRRPDRLNEVEVVPLRGADGAVTGGLVVSRDVTEQVQYIEALAHSEQRLRQLSAASIDMLALYDVDGIYLEVSEASERLFGWTPEQLVGRSSYELFHPDDLAAVRAVHEAVLERPEDGSVTYRMRCADGTYRWVEVNGHQVLDPETGDVVAIQCTTRDVTRRREVDEQLRKFRGPVPGRPDRRADRDGAGGRRRRLRRGQYGPLPHPGPHGR
ncbi:MAG: PAS domain S-box protein [Egicoccus sp.]